METLQELFFAYPVLSLAQTAFMIWMLVDAARRRADYYWFWIIFTGIGAWAYFFVVKLPDFRATHLAAGGLGSLFQRRPSLDELRYRAEHTPTLVNHLNLAHRLIEQKQHAEALPHLQAALKTEPEHGTALYSLALCHKEMGNPDLAQPVLEGLLAREPRWSNYVAWHLLIDVRTQAGNPAGAVEACRQLVRLAPTLEHHCLLAEHLLAAGHAEEARNLLERSLRDHDFAPGPIRRRNRRWASEARRLLKQAAGLPGPASR
jgi:hypothetical protein